MCMKKAHANPGRHLLAFWDWKFDFQHGTPRRNGLIRLNFYLCKILTPSPFKILALSLCVSRIFQLSTWHFWNVPKTQHRTKMSCSAFRFLWTWSTTTTKWIQITAIVITTHQILNFQLPSFQIHFDQFAHMYVDIQPGHTSTLVARHTILRRMCPLY